MFMNDDLDYVRSNDKVILMIKDDDYYYHYHYDHRFPWNLWTVLRFVHSDV